MKDKYIIKPFNKIYCVFFICFGLFSYIFGTYMKILDVDNKYSILITLSILNIVIFIVYRYLMQFDKEYIDIWYKDYGKVNYYNELPLYPCNVVLLLYPIAFIFRNRFILSFCFFMCIVGPCFALINPTKGFEKYSIFKPRVLFYYLTHTIELITAPLLVLSNLYIPTFLDTFNAVIMLFIMMSIAHVVNIYLIKSEKNNIANYFYTMHDEGVGLLKFFYKKFPHKYFYMLESVPVIWGIFLAITIITILLV